MFVICNECKSLLGILYWHKEDNTSSYDSTMHVSINELKDIPDINNMMYSHSNKLPLVRAGDKIIDQWVVKFFDNPYYYLTSANTYIRDVILESRDVAITRCDHLTTFTKEDSEEEGCTVFSPRNYPDVVY